MDYNKYQKIVKPTQKLIKGDNEKIDNGTINEDDIKKFLIRQKHLYIL